MGDIEWPDDSTLVAILRDHAPITPSRDDVIDGGDELFFVTTIAAEDELRALLSPDAAESSAQPEEDETPGGQVPSGAAQHLPAGITAAPRMAVRRTPMLLREWRRRTG